MSSLQALAIRKNLVVSIGTVDTRQHQVVQTVQSILKQTVLPAQIQIHYSSIRNEYNVEWVRQQILMQYNEIHQQRRMRQGRLEPSSLPSIDFYPAEDGWRSATKLLGALKRQHEIQDKMTTSETAPKTTTTITTANLLVTADDDFVYSPRWLESFLVGHLQFPQAAVGLRGWRVKSNLDWGAPPVGNRPHPEGVWGSFPSGERYIILGSNLCQPYQVGVLTGVNGVLYQTDMFRPDIFEAPDPVYLSMDDIWISGHLANRSIARYVIPMCGQETAGLHMGQHKSVIDPQNKGISRSEVNNRVLRHYGAAWRKENRFWSPDDAPVLAGFLPLRHWLSEHVILGLYSVGFVRRAVGSWKLVDE